MAADSQTLNVSGGAIAALASGGIASKLSAVTAALSHSSVTNNKAARYGGGIFNQPGNILNPGPQVGKRRFSGSTLSGAGPRRSCRSSYSRVTSSRRQSATRRCRSAFFFSASFESNPSASWATWRLFITSRSARISSRRSRSALTQGALSRFLCSRSACPWRSSVPLTSMHASRTARVRVPCRRRAFARGSNARARRYHRDAVDVPFGGVAHEALRS